ITRFFSPAISSTTLLPTLTIFGFGSTLSSARSGAATRATKTDANSQTRMASPRMVNVRRTGGGLISFVTVEYGNGYASSGQTFPGGLMTVFTKLADECKQRRPDAFVVLGSGMGSLVGRFPTIAEATFDQVPGMRATTVAGHHGRFVLCKRDGGTVLL